MDIVKADPARLDDVPTASAPVAGPIVSFVFRPRCEQGRHRYQQGAEPKDDLLWCPRCGDVVPFAPDPEDDR